ncbi:MAG: tetratricopeptide repeat protein [Bryobacteraceae bacterium]
MAAAATQVGHPCVSCHAKEVEGFSRSAMAHSLSPADHAPAGAFEHRFSGTKFTINSVAGEVRQTVERPGLTESLTVQYAIGSGNHAVGYLARVGDHLFQSPVAYYTNRGLWDVAPGYEDTPDPDFSRPVTVECLDCHSGKPLEKPDTLNSYEAPFFAPAAIGCERCHGDPAAHLRSPLPGTIVNPARLSPSTRDSVCEQCHLAGEVRIPNPGKSVADFRPGHPLEDTFTVYVAERRGERTIKVISHSEQLAQSACARMSGGRLWCGTCHNPHETPVQKAAYYRERCLSCHAATLEPSHAARGRDCVACHMPRRNAKDGGHTAFTDHRITRRPEPEGEVALANDLAAWREPESKLRERNLALALVTVGMGTNNRDEIIRGYRMLNKVVKQFPNDAPVLTALGTIVLTAKETAAAGQYFERALELRPNYAPYRVNLATALLAEGNTAEAARQLEQAVELDPLLEQAVQLLSRVYKMQGQSIKAEELTAKYRAAMGITIGPVK